MLAPVAFATHIDSIPLVTLAQLNTDEVSAPALCCLLLQTRERSCSCLHRSQSPTPDTASLSAPHTLYAIFCLLPSDQWHTQEEQTQAARGAAARRASSCVLVAGHLSFPPPPLAVLPHLQIFALLGVHEFMPSVEILSRLEGSLCTLRPELCVSMLSALCGYNPDNLDPALLPTIVAYTPSGTSVQNMAHWSQVCRLGGVMHQLSSTGQGGGQSQPMGTLHSCTRTTMHATECQSVLQGNTECRVRQQWSAYAQPPCVLSAAAKQWPSTSPPSLPLLC